MNERVEQSCQDIITLLDLANRPISLRNLSHYLGVPYYIINFSIARLIRNGHIEVEVMGKENYVRRSAPVTQPQTVKQDALQLV